MLDKTSRQNIDWAKGEGLVPVVVQDVISNVVLMLGYMNEEALKVTEETGKVTFFSRSKQRLWTKGETSRNYLILESIAVDCDGDTLLIKARPQGPTCHLGTNTCFGEMTADSGKFKFIQHLEQLIAARHEAMPPESYTTSLFEAGTKRIAQKVGEEGVEVALAATAGDNEELLNESADLIFHLLVLLRDKKLSFLDVIAVLESRH